MTSSYARRVAACIASVAAAAAVLPATASAKPKTEGPEGAVRCSGANIEGRGSTFQDPAQVVWNAEFNANPGKYGCKETPTVKYRNTESKDRGSGSCLKAFGAEKHAVERSIDFCGTDEAPNPKQAGEIESHAEAGFLLEEGPSFETIPVEQGAVAVLVHLPKGCTASSNADVDGKTAKKARLVLNQATVEGLYRGTINNWNELLAAQGGAGEDAIKCSNEEEKKDKIVRVVRQDHSGTTHIFKTFLEQVNNAPFEAEAYPEEYFGSKTSCGTTYPAEPGKTWSVVSEGCENQRWPAAAEVVHTEAKSGNQGVIEYAGATESSVAYADVAFAQEYHFFSKEGEGGEVSKARLKKGEGEVRFWAPVQNTPTSTSYAEPTTEGDSEAKLTKENSNCAESKYVESGEKAFPPETTRDLWYEAKASNTEENYPICGLTYDLAYRQYGAFEFGAEAKGIAITVENYLRYVVSPKGGGKALKGHDYYPLPAEVVEKAETGIQEIGDLKG